MTHCFSVVTYYVVSYYRFLNTDPELKVVQSKRLLSSFCNLILLGPTALRGCAIRLKEKQKHFATLQKYLVYNIVTSEAGS
jgi:hypothetical protein